jgi:hypothetical protein
VAVGWTVVYSSVWAFWGGAETFHEGWYSESILRNLFVAIWQYLVVTIASIAAALYAIHRPKVGAAAHVLIAALLLYRFRGKLGPIVIIGLPFLISASLYYFGRPWPRAAASATVVAVPLLVAVSVGAAPAYRVWHRLDDGYRGARVIVGNGVAPVWAPKGPGWPDDGISWDKACEVCRHLAEDGVTLKAAPQSIWRLPAVAEAVQSMARGGINCGGTWDEAGARARYSRRPDKETPLWDPRSKIIYWWTSTEVDGKTVYRVVYNGSVYPTEKVARWGYLGFRCVREPFASEIARGTNERSQSAGPMSLRDRQ